MFISLSSTMRMHSPVKATSVSLRCLPPRQEGVQLPQQGAGTVVSLHHDCLCGLAQARPVVFGEILTVQTITGVLRPDSVLRKRSSR